MFRKRVLFLLALLFVEAGSAWAAEPAPYLPKEYQVRFRYQIDAFGLDHVRIYQDMVKQLKALGLQPDPRPEEEAADRDKDRMSGTVAAENVRKLLNERHVKSLLLIPKGAKAVEPADAPVRVHLDLAAGLALDRQRLLAQQAREVLGPLGFREAPVYDHRGFTRLVGSFPADKLDGLLNDLRRRPAGAKTPAPFAARPPLQVIEVLPEVPLPKDRPKLPEPPADQEKVAPGLRALLAQEDEKAKPRRLEVILNYAPGPRDRGWEGDLAAAAPGIVLEGRLGPLVSVVARTDQVGKLAGVPAVSVVRLPQPARETVLVGPAGPGDDRALLRAASLDRLHALGHRGRGVRVAVVDGDFRGWHGAVLSGQLPADTRYVDLTAQRDADLRPDPFSDDGAALGHGTRCALAAAQAAPEAEVTLVRVDPSAPYQLLEVAQYVNGEAVTSYHLERRGVELAVRKQELDDRRAKLAQERRGLLDDFGQDVLGRDREDEYRKKKEAYFKKQREYDRDEAAYHDLAARFLKLRLAYRDLREVRVVAATPAWNEGHPVDGGSPLSRYFDDKPFRAALWFQAAGNTRGQSWSGPFRDADGNGVMEFAAPADPERSGPWWRLEANFLAWQPPGGKAALDLPAKARLRLALQWREAHDPEFWKNGEDLYLKPLASPRLVLLRQPDPAGAKQPADDLEVVAYSVGPALRLYNEPNSAVYEQTLEAEVPAAGRYAVRVEGAAPTSTRPDGVPTLPARRQSWEFRPRLYVETLSGGGRAVFQDFATDAGGTAVPADARRVLTVGAADGSNKRQPYSAGGPPLGVDLMAKPDLLAYDGWALGGSEAARGTGVAAGFAAGSAACLFSAGMPPSQFVKTLPPPGEVLRVPEKRLRTR